MTAEAQRRASQTPPSAAAVQLPTRRVPRDLRTPVRWAAALLMPIGPICIAVLRFILPYNTLYSSATMVTKIVAEPGRESAVLWLTFIATFTLLPGIFVAGRAAGRAGPGTPDPSDLASPARCARNRSIGWAGRPPRVSDPEVRAPDCAGHLPLTAMKESSSGGH